MKYIAICARGLEDITQLEIKEIVHVSSEVFIPGRVLFSCDTVDSLLKKTRSIIKLYELRQVCASLDEIAVFPVASPFRIECSRQGNHTFSSQDVQRRVGELFFRAGNTVDLKHPISTVFVDIVENTFLVGRELHPSLLSKRSYRIKPSNQSINACIAYGLVRLSGYMGKKILLEPFSRDGVIAIEAALYKKGKIFSYDALFAYVKNTEIHATLAGVRKEINISRIEPEWLDTKFEKNEVSFVVTCLPYPTHVVSEKDIRVLYKELFYQLTFIVKKKGVLVFLAPRLDLLKEFSSGFSLVEERAVSTSSQVYSVLVFKKE